MLLLSGRGAVLLLSGCGVVLLLSGCCCCRCCCCCCCEMLSGCGAVLLWILRQLVVHRRTLRGGTPILSGPARELAEEIAREFSMKRVPSLWLSPSAATPSPSILRARARRSAARSTTPRR